MHAFDLVVLALEAQRALSRPEAADDGERLFERVHRFLCGAPWSSHGLDCIPERARAYPQLDAAAAQQIE